MDDMDAESEELGGKRKLLSPAPTPATAGPNSWHPHIGGHDDAQRSIRRSASQKMPENPGIPRAVSATSSRTPTSLTATPRPCAGLPQGSSTSFSYDHSASASATPSNICSRVLGSAGRCRPVPHPAPHHRLHGRSHRPEEKRKCARPRLRHGGLPDFGVEAHPQAQHQGAVG